MRPADPPARKALVVAHGHPDFGAGGGELAAHGLFKALRGHERVREARFLARTGEPRLPPGAVGQLRPGEHLIRRDIADWPLLRARPDAAPEGRGLGAFLAEFSPDIVFLHHVVHLGLDTIAEIRDALPRTRIVLTLHDYLGICRNQGLMVTTGAPGGLAARLSASLCRESGAEPCARCFPDEAPDAYRKRLRRFEEAFALVDAFAAPSAFLAERYERWGLDPARLHVIDNGAAPPGRPLAPPDFGGPLRLGFFGQARPPKGLHVALAGLHHLPPALRAKVRLEVNASRLEAQEAWYRTLVERLAAPLLAEGVLDWRGAYGRDGLTERMAAVDAVLVPSTWWENAPLVIGEAFAHGRPVLGSRIGGISEMVTEGENGLLFEPGDARGLAAILDRLLSDPALGRALSPRVTRPPSPSTTATAYLDLAETAPTRTLEHPAAHGHSARAPEGRALNPSHD